MTCPAGGHAPRGGVGTAQTQDARRFYRCGALSVDALTSQVTLEQPGRHFATVLRSDSFIQRYPQGPPHSPAMSCHRPQARHGA